MMTRRTFLTAALGVPTLAVMAKEKPWPEKPIRMIIPFGPGAASDMVARSLAEQLQHTLEQTVIVENKAGASGQIAANLAAQAASDGYTFILTSNTTHSANPFLFKELSYDPIEDFAPVTRVCDFPFVLAVNAELPIDSVAQLIAHTREKKNTNYGYGNSTGQIAGASLNHLMEMQSVGVSYKSVPQVVVDILGGRIHWAFIDMANAFPHMESGKLRAIAVSSGVRSKLTPDLPTITEETGLKDFDLTAWGAIFGPAGVPKRIIERLNKEVNIITGQESFREKLRVAGVEVQQSTPEELRDFVSHQLDVWKRKIDEAQIQPV